MTIQKWPDGLPRSGNQQFDKLTPVNNWFEVFQINESTFAFLEPHHDEEVFSYLLLGGNQAVLIDTGMGVSNIQNEVKNITSLPVTVLNTHTHFDHTGDNFRFNDIACFDDSFEFANLNNGHSNQFCIGFMQPGSYRNLPAGFKPDEYEIKPSKVTKKLQHSDQIDIGGRVLKIHHTPGHSPGSVCIEDLKYRLLFTGDTYYRGTIFLHLIGSSYGDYIKSVEYLYGIKHNLKGLCPGHNECFAPIEDIEELCNAITNLGGNPIESGSNGAPGLFQFDHFNLRIPLGDIYIS